MNLNLFDGKLTKQLNALTAGAVTEVYKLGNGQLVVLIKNAVNGHIIHSTTEDVTRLEGKMYEYETIWAASFALVNWDPFTQPHPSQFIGHAGTKFKASLSIVPEPPPEIAA
jgi:hypothetical protein